MSKVLRISEDNYRIQVKDQGIITLDVGDSPGKVVITGDIQVLGESTIINTTQTTIEDRIITLNKSTDNDAQDIADGILDIDGKKQSGIEINRGTRITASLIFDDAKSWYSVGAGAYDDETPGLWVTNGGEGEATEITAIQTAGLVSDYTHTRDITFDLRNTTKALRVINSSNYDTHVVDDNHIPNKKWVQLYMVSGGIAPGIADVNRIYKGPAVPALSPYNLYSEVIADGTNITNGTVTIRLGSTNNLFQFTPNGLIFDNSGIKIHQSTISSVTGTVKITAQNKIIQADGYLRLDERPSVDLPAPLTVTNVAQTAVIFSSPVKGAGKTGIYFAHQRTNEDDTATESVNDELIAKNRALLFSMLF